MKRIGKVELLHTVHSVSGHVVAMAFKLSWICSWEAAFIFTEWKIQQIFWTTSKLQLNKCLVRLLIQSTHYHKKLLKMFLNCGCSHDVVYWKISASPHKSLCWPQTCSRAAGHTFENRGLWPSRKYGTVTERDLIPDVNIVKPTIVVSQLTVAVWSLMIGLYKATAWMKLQLTVLYHWPLLPI